MARIRSLPYYTALESEFDSKTNSISKIPVWIRVLKISMNCFNKEFLAKIGNQFGKTLIIDETTLVGARGRFAQISIQVDLSKPLRSKFRYRRHIHTIEYKGLHTVCFNCGKYGHKTEGCPKNSDIEQDTNEKDVVMNPKEIEKTIKELRPELFQDFWSVVLAKKFPHRRRVKEHARNFSTDPKSTQNPNLESGRNKRSNGSRFSIQSENGNVNVSKFVLQGIESSKEAQISIPWNENIGSSDNQYGVNKSANNSKIESDNGKNKSIINIKGSSVTANNTSSGSETKSTPIPKSPLSGGSRPKTPKPIPSKPNLASPSTKTSNQDKPNPSSAIVSSSLSTTQVTSKGKNVVPNTKISTTIPPNHNSPPNPLVPTLPPPEPPNNGKAPMDVSSPKIPLKDSNGNSMDCGKVNVTS